VIIGDALTIEVYPGDCAMLTEPFVANMQRSAPSRYLMENLQPAKKQQKADKYSNSRSITVLL
jgi:hypothetical protein